ncbi:MAG TPA: FGGY family carbohydrate kinase [Candidatus Limnocylindrales bacterium]|nr:FGGY family carbohydrate kinase [Candidatus Limnocylindrales bacterium]
MLVLGIDQGSSGSKAILLDGEGVMRGSGYRPVRRLHPEPAWTEQDPAELATTVADAITEALGRAGATADEVLAAGIASQRNTDVVWDAATGLPLANAISWQDMRTHALLAELRADDSVWPEAHRRLGQLPGHYSASLHLMWRMRHDQAVIDAARDGRLRVGLPGEWVIQALGTLREHAVDFSLAQALSCYDIRVDDWWGPFLDRIGVPHEALPAVRPTLHPYGSIRVADPAGGTADVPVLALLADQQAALFGYDCRRPGDAECTHGTASYLDVCAGPTKPEAARMQSYYAWTLPRPLRGPDGRPPATPDAIERTWCVEGDATVTGAAIRWLREGIGLLGDEREIGPLAATVADAGGVTFVPAFTGLNAPDRDERARASILGLTLGSTKAHVARALLDSIGFQVRAMLDEVEDDLGMTVEHLKVGGGISASDVACQVQADRLGIPVERPAFTDTTPRAAALLAGLGAGTWATLDALPPLPGGSTVFEPAMPAARREAEHAHWRRTIDLVRAHGS